MEEERIRNVFVMGLSDFHRRELATIRNADRYRFHALFEEDEIVHRESYDIPALYREAVERLERFDDAIDAVIGHWDFPVSSMVPLLCRRFDLTGPSVESVLRCTHKYWSRIAQREAVPECTPDFELVDPFDPRAADRLELGFPLWLKPVKSYASQLGFRIEDRRQLDEALATIRERIGQIAEPYNALMDLMELPEELRRIDAGHCLAEQLVGGHEIAPEGSVHRGRIDVHGVIDMPRSEGSFDRFAYPAELPGNLEERLEDVVRRVIGHIGYDDACFNIEFFHDAERDRLWIVEINPRISQSHSYLFEKVDGASNHDVAVAVAQDMDPEMPRRQGRYGAAAKCLLRAREDGVVVRVPDDRELVRIHERHPDCIVEPAVREGQVLHDLPEQDAYSYLLAAVYVCGRDHRDMLERYRRIVEELDIRIDHRAA